MHNKSTKKNYLTQCAKSSSAKLNSAKKITQIKYFPRFGAVAKILHK